MSYFSYSFVDRNFYDTYGTEEDAFDAAVFEARGSADRKPFYLAFLHPYEPHWTTDAERIVDEICDDIADEIATDVVSNIASEEAIKELDKELDACISKWVKKNQIGKEYNLISWVKRFVWDSTLMEYVQDYDYE